MSPDDWPEQLDEIEREHEADADEDDLAAGFAAHAELKWSAKLLLHAIARLHIAGDVHGHNAARHHADDAADALHAAGKLAPPPHRTQLLRLSCRLNEALAGGGYPSGQTLEAVADQAEALLAALKQEAGA